VIRAVHSFTLVDPQNWLVHISNAHQAGDSPAIINLSPQGNGVYVRSKRILADSRFLVNDALLITYDISAVKVTGGSPSKRGIPPSASGGLMP